MTESLTLTREEVEALRRCMAVLAPPNGSMVRDATPADRKALASVLGKLGVEPDGTLRTVNWCPPNTGGPFNGIAVPDALRRAWANGAGGRSYVVGEFLGVPVVVDPNLPPGTVRIDGAILPAPRPEDPQ